MRANFLAASAIFVALGMCGGCLMDPSAREGAPAAAASADQSKSLRDAPATGNTGVPVGCSREWSDAAMDSVLDCPDIRPPKPK